MELYFYGAFLVYRPLKVLYNSCRIHTLMHTRCRLLIRSNFGFSILLKGTLACSWGSQRLEPATLWLLDDLFSLLSYSCCFGSDGWDSCYYFLIFISKCKVMTRSYNIYNTIYCFWQLMTPKMLTYSFLKSEVKTETFSDLVVWTLLAALLTVCVLMRKSKMIISPHEAHCFPVFSVWFCFFHSSFPFSAGSNLFVCGWYENQTVMIWIPNRNIYNPNTRNKHWQSPSVTLIATTHGDTDGFRRDDRKTTRHLVFFCFIRSVLFER